MKSGDVRAKYIDFFVGRGHKLIPPAPLVLADDPTTLFTSSGMQPLVPYLLGQPHPSGTRLVDFQPSFRAQDIEEVGDTSHTTFFEMLGNWSLGDYFKKEQLAWFWEFLTKELGLPKKRLAVTVFAGNKDVLRDEESARIWKSLGVTQERIFYYGVETNWWSRAGVPEAMPVGEPGGPDSEVFFEFDKVKHDPKFGKVCHPNCDCGRFLEIGNSVFMQYQKQASGSVKELSQKNVDFGGGLERLTAATNDNPDVFQIEIYKPIIEKIEKVSGKKYQDNSVQMRIISDHMRATTALIAGGVIPSNKLQGYVLRRLIRRAAIKMRSLKLDMSGKDFEEISGDKQVVAEEIDRFKKTLDKGLKLVGKISPFDLFQTYGFPPEITEELLRQKGADFDKEEFKKEFEKHKNLSRTASAGMFKGGLANHSVAVTKLHTATHLLHQALRQILGKHVRQEGSNITAERLRFDFSHPEPITDEQIIFLERLVNDKIKENLPVHHAIEDKDKAVKSGALAFFREKYGDKVSVYTIGKDAIKDWWSKELCGGPHVKITGKIGSVRIDKVQSIGTFMKRIYASLA